MTSAGEKQHYALALIEKLVENIPHDMNIGLLYDIGCQLECSWRKWGFFEDAILSRFEFVISVFHPYGHQWPCQIIYHPRKRQGFGLSDGEGCERLWSALKPLIAPLRVSGFHQWIFVLDMQIVKPVNDLQSVKLGVSKDELRAEWRSQVRHQTKPSPRQSSKKGEQEITKILEMEDLLAAHAEAIATLKLQLMTNRIVDLATFNMEITEAHAHHNKSNKYLRLRMNTLTLKTRLRERLRQCKFELERIERSYRQTINEQQLHSHADSAVKRCEPTILRLVSTYNDICDKLDAFIRQKKALRGAIPPDCISREGIFDLDVDDNIWQDIGLRDEDANPPAWLADDDVRAGIKALLEKDRCVEEEQRLLRERCYLQEWLVAEVTAVEAAKANQVGAGDMDMLFALDVRREELCQLAMRWQAKVRPMPTAWPMPASWGSVHNTEVPRSGGRGRDGGLGDGEVWVDEDDDWESEGEKEDDELLDALENFGLWDQWRMTDTDEIEEVRDEIFYDPQSSPVWRS
ncbi:hypothetical protein HYDPIDRAFT_31467 [Hydnomerulius pinastri MD-312]|uniref:CxC1-like cysteine cluster associated with KDZ transposases domain-containing protein n=1 Tax=Hydnomerulius pinastri MD-312 TaxID=994086 RepID=A0A0C9W4H8_9AGAM|nr:hypothetical protein HYDPIDRAFT_31467 [Hydnomerulius pinastri MD-312]